MAKSVRSTTTESIYGWNDDSKARVESDGVLGFYADKLFVRKTADDLSSSNDESASFDSQAGKREVVSTSDEKDGDSSPRAPEGVEGQ